MADNGRKGSRKSGSSRRKKLWSGNRQGAEHNLGKAPDRPPFISCGKTEKIALRCLFNHKGRSDYFHVRSVAKDLNLPRTTLRDALERLVAKKLATKTDYPANFKISEKGEQWLHAFETYGENRSRGGRQGSLSYHDIRYKSKILKMSQAFENNVLDHLKKLNPNKLWVNPVFNLKQHIAYFDDATIIVSKNKVIVHIHDIVKDDIDACHYEAFTRAMEYLEKVRKLGCVLHNIELERGHYARVQSILAETFQKVKDKYFLELGDGHQFWIDRSTGELEDETNSDHYRDRLDTVMRSINESESDFRDLDKVISIVNGLVKATANLAEMQSRSLNPYSVVPEEPKSQDMRTYFG
jgi:DNA-binding MarR family transcriptional regulator